MDRKEDQSTFNGPARPLNMTIVRLAQCDRRSAEGSESKDGMLAEFERFC